jgi:hypothetical protein
MTEAVVISAPKAAIGSIGSPRLTAGSRNSGKPIDRQLRRRSCTTLWAVSFSAISVRVSEAFGQSY